MRHFSREYFEKMEKQVELYQERRKDLLQEYNALCPNAIIIIKYFQDYGTRFSFTQTVQTAVFDKETYNFYIKQNFSFCKSDKEYSYYYFFEYTRIYLNEHDWNILTGKTKY